MNLLKSTVPIEKFTPHVIAATFDEKGETSLPENAALSFIRNAAISFAEKTGILKETIKVDLQCGLSEYPIETRECETVIYVKSAKYNEFASEDCGNAWSWGNVDFTFNDDLLTIYPAPSQDVEEGLILEVVIIPKRDACELDSQFYNKWFDAVVNGALYELHLMPNRPWSSVSRADYRKRLFHEDIGRATVRDRLQGNPYPMKMSLSQNWKRCKGRMW